MTVTDNDARKRFEIQLSDGDVAFADYRIDGDTITFPHTLVPQRHRGEGIGTALIHAAIDLARARSLQVAPSCPFFAAWFKRHPDQADLLAEGWRAKLGLD